MADYSSARQPHPRGCRRFISLGMLALAALTTRIAAAADHRESIDYFETHVRAVLVDRCYSCHSAQAAKGIKGGLRLDTREHLLKGGDSGPAVVPGDPDKSLLIQAVRYTSEALQMPPKGERLPAEVVHHLENWVRMGAPDPRVENAPRAENPAESAARRHWAFTPVKPQPLPRSQYDRLIESPIDAFLLARLDREGLTPAPKADRRTLIRRATFDLHGLPPTPEETEAFERDPSPRAYAALIDRLLASPRYGERWARHWLDVARYADSKGYVFEEERRYPYSYTYRDYVVRALNEDLPFDQFIVEQLAADRLELGGDSRPLAALGFLTLGRRFLNNPHDIIDDRIDVVSRGLLGLTVACARCHDHKFDPIPARDYYSLYGVFSSSHEPPEKPLLGTNAIPIEYPAYQAERQRRVQERDEFRTKRNREIRKALRDQVGDYLVAANDAAKFDDAGKREALARERKLDPGVLRRWISRLETSAKQADTPLSPWVALTTIPEDRFEQEAARRLEPFLQPAGAPLGAVTLIAHALSEPAPKSLREAAANLQRLLSAIDTEWESAATNGSPAALADSQREAVRQVLYHQDYPTVISDDDIPRLYDVPTAQKSRALQRKVEELDATHPGAPPRAMALLDNAKPANARIFIRGNPQNPGPEAPRGFLSVLTPPGSSPFTNGSGRLELARAIASRDNPLTARVLVNRIWMHHFGTPLVRTPADFGLRSEPPTHPELLDDLAARFMDEGWSLKNLHRLLMLSHTYQQSCEGTPETLARDPGNVLLGRMNRRRLDFESMRDTLLTVAGTVDLRAGGHAVDIVAAPFSRRRTVYGFVERQNLPGMFRTFDFASPDVSTPQRFATTVPQQALFLMNSPFALEQSQAFVRRVADAPSADHRIRELHRLAYQRAPAPEEIAAAKAFLGPEAVSSISACAAPCNSHGKTDPAFIGPPAPAPPHLTPWEQYAQVLLLSNELMFVD